MCEPQWMGGSTVWAWTGMMCVDLTPVSPGSCNPDLNPPSSWPQSLAFGTQMPLGREASSGGKAQDGFKWWFFAGEVTQTDGLRRLSNSNLCRAWRVNLGVQTFGTVHLIIILVALLSEMLKQRLVQGLKGTTHSPSECSHRAACISPCVGLKALGYFWGRGNFSSCCWCSQRSPCQLPRGPGQQLHCRNSREIDTF